MISTTTHDSAAAAAAIARLRAAIEEPGPRPDIHQDTITRHRREWPTLWQAIDAILSAPPLPTASVKRFVAEGWAVALTFDGPLSDVPTGVLSMESTRFGPPLGDILDRYNLHNQVAELVQEAEDDGLNWTGIDMSPITS